MSRFIEQRDMTVKDWIGLPDHPLQRLTEEHAILAKNRHLKNPHPAQAHVEAIRCTFDDENIERGSLFKADGHTRAFLWEQNELDAPDLLKVNVWDADSIDDAYALYKTFNNRSAAHSTQDDAYSAQKLTGIRGRLNSPLFTNRRYVSGLNLAYQYCSGTLFVRTENITDVSHFYFREEILILDDCGPKTRDFPVGVLAGAMITIAAYDEIDSFWDKYSKDLGTKLEAEIDAIEGLRRMVGTTRTTRGKSDVFEMMRKTIGAVERHRRGLTYRSNTGVKGIRDLQPLLKRVRRLKSDTAA